MMKSPSFNIRVVLPAVVILLILLAAAYYWLAPVLRFIPKDCLNGSYAAMFKGEAPGIGKSLNQEDVKGIIETLLKQINAEADQPEGYIGYISTLQNVQYRRAWELKGGKTKEIAVDDFINAWNSSPSPNLPARTYNISFFAEKYGLICVRLDVRYNQGLKASSRGGFSEMWVFRRVWWLAGGWEAAGKQKIFMFD
jgi:hypothetical protein